jgi:hypothetical protein
VILGIKSMCEPSGLYCHTFMRSFIIRWLVQKSFRAESEGRSKVVTTLALYLGNPGFRSRLADRLFWLKTWFSSVPPANYRDSTLSGHDRFLPYLLTSSVNHSIYPTICSWATDSCVKPRSIQGEKVTFKHTLAYTVWNVLVLWIWKCVCVCEG